MNLHEALHLNDAKTNGVDLIPTTNFFKPVIVLDAPISLSQAKLLGCEYMFTSEGESVSFQGSFQLVGEIQAAEVTLAGKSTKAVTFKTQKIAKFALFLEEKTGMRLRVRIHLVEDEKKLIELLHFLAKLNKDPFNVSIVDRQRSMNELIDGPNGAKGDRAPFVGTLRGGDQPAADPSGVFTSPVIDGDGVYPLDLATVRPHSAGQLQLKIYLLEVEPDRWISTYLVEWRTQLQGGGGDLTPEQRRYEAPAFAIAESARQMKAIVAKLNPKTPADKKHVASGLDWLDQCIESNDPEGDGEPESAE